MPIDPLESLRRSSTISRRRRFADAEQDFENVRILEFGPGDRPTFWRPDGHVKYIDWCSREELASQYRGNPRKCIDRIPDIDFVVKGPHFSRHIQEKFDLFVASHVLEHVPDAITWFSEISALSGPDARLLLALPDKRFTFDRNRQLTDMVELYRCHTESLERPSFWQILRHSFYFARNASPPDGDATPPARRRTFEDARALAERRSRDYSDTHCHVFSHDSFPELMGDLFEAGLVDWKLEKTRDVIPDGIEFLALLRRAGSGSRAQR